MSACGSSPPPASPSPQLERALERGQVLYDAQQYAEAAEVLLHALLEAEAEDDLYGRAVGYVSLAQCQVRLGNEQAAARMLGEAGRILPRLAAEQPGLEAGEVHLLQGRYHEAQAELATAAGRWREAAEHLNDAEHHYQQAKRS